LELPESRLVLPLAARDGSRPQGAMPSAGKVPSVCRKASDQVRAPGISLVQDRQRAGSPFHRGRQLCLLTLIPLPILVVGFLCHGEFFVFQENFRLNNGSFAQKNTKIGYNSHNFWKVSKKFCKTWDN